MGYRHYLYLVPKETIDKVSKLSLADAKHASNVDDVSIRDLIGNRVVHEFGKSSICEIAYEYSIPLFLDADTAEYFDDYNAVVIGEEGLVALINEHRKVLVEDLDENIVASPEELKVNNQFTMECKKRELAKPYDPMKIKETGRLPDSWVLEYSMFGLIHLHHTIDWNNNELVLMGW